MIVLAIILLVLGCFIYRPLAYAGAALLIIAVIVWALNSATYAYY